MASITGMLGIILMLVNLNLILLLTPLLCKLYTRTKLFTQNVTSKEQIEHEKHKNDWDGPVTVLLSASS